MSLDAFVFLQLRLEEKIGKMNLQENTTRTWWHMQSSIVLSCFSFDFLNCWTEHLKKKNNCWFSRLSWDGHGACTSLCITVSPSTSAALSQTVLICAKTVTFRCVGCRVNAGGKGSATSAALLHYRTQRASQSSRRGNPCWRVPPCTAIKETEVAHIHNQRWLSAVGTGWEMHGWRKYALHRQWTFLRDAAQMYPLQH